MQLPLTWTSVALPYPLLGHLWDVPLILTLAPMYSASKRSSVTREQYYLTTFVGVSRQRTKDITSFDSCVSLISSYHCCAGHHDSLRLPDRSIHFLEDGRSPPRGVQLRHESKYNRAIVTRWSVAILIHISNE